MEEEDDDLYGPSETPAPAATKTEEVKNEDDASSGDEPMDEGLESGEEDESDSDSVRCTRGANTQWTLTKLRTSKSSSTSLPSHQSPQSMSPLYPCMLSSS